MTSRERAIRVVFQLMRDAEGLDNEAFAQRALRAQYDDVAAQQIINDAPLEKWSGDAVPTARDRIQAALDAHAKEAVEAEREECAVVADSYQTDDWTTCPDRCVDHHNGHCSCIIVRRLATAIRARSKKRARRLRLDAETAKEALDED